MTKQTDNFDFAKSVSELETIVDELERGEIALDKALIKFERGAELAQQLQAYLEKTELKINTIKAKFDSPKLD